MRSSCAGLLALAWLAAGCQGSEPELDDLWARSTSRVRTQKTTTAGVDGTAVEHQRPHLLDAFGRYVHIRGVNVSGSHKAPPTEEFPSRYPLPADPALKESCKGKWPLPAECVPELRVSYVGRPFPLEDADRWYGLLAGLGFNSIRLLTNWESVQPYRPGTCAGKPGYSAECYDLQYLEYFGALVAKAREHGIYVLVDMHQDIYSRHVMAYYNEKPRYGDPPKDTTPGSVEDLVLSLLPPYTDFVRGHGAPRWVVETSLPEKNLDSKYWGWPRMIGAIITEDGIVDGAVLAAISNLWTRFNPGGGELPEWLSDLFSRLPDERFDVTETSDMLPVTPWILAGGLSLDVSRGFAAFFAGDKVFPQLVVDTDGKTRRRDELASQDGLPGLSTYLQAQYRDAYLQLVERVKGYDNVIGYDLMNEPVGVFLMLAVAGLYASLDLEPETTGGGDPTEPVQDLLVSMLGEELGKDIFAVVRGLALVPTDTKPETLRKWGMADIDLATALDLNFAFDAHYLQPFYEMLGKAVQQADPNAIIWFEPGASLRQVTGASPFFDQPLTRPQGIDQLVYAPHWYPDIYPLPGIDSEPREFNADEWLYRDFTAPLRKHLEESPGWLGNVPVVFGEFGTYFNFGGIEASKQSGYMISAHVLDRYYEAFEELGLGNMVWCFSAENDHEYGEHWNHEDFSIIGPDGEPRAWPAYVRTHVRATAGKLVRQRFRSQYHFWDPQQGSPPVERTYELEMELQETAAPTEVFVPRRVYPDGFYVWLSDGMAYYDHARQILYWYASQKGTGAIHRLEIAPRVPDVEALGWSYFFHDGRVLTGAGDSVWTGGGEP